MNNELTDFLLWVISGPGVATILSLALEYVPYLSAWFDPKSFEAKRTIVFLACLILPLTATGLLHLLGVEPVSANALFRAITAGFAGYATSQFAHMIATREERAIPKYDGSA